jgi:N-hydroxyarylamine O-acetyltransferase
MNFGQQIDLDAYCARIGYTGPREPTLAALTAIHVAHPAAIPFENLDPLLARGVSLDLDAIQKKLVGARRGGYCFEQNGLFAAALQAMGFKLTGLAGRVLLNHAPGTTRRSHMLLKVDLPEGAHIADVGLGSWALSAPLRLFDEGEQQTPHGRFRIIRNGEFFDEQARVRNDWTTLYRFTLEEQIDDDYEVANWFTAAHPRSHFRHRLMVARLPQGLRLGMLNNRFSVHYPDGRVDRRELGTAQEIAATLESDFGIALPASRDELLAALTRLIPQ